MKGISAQDIIEEYKKGRRDFTSIVCKDADFTGMDLSGANFSDSDMSFSTFKTATLNDCNFSNCVLDWTSFIWAKLIRTDFTNAKIRWSVLNDATFEKTILRKADLSWSLLFNVNFHDSDITGADFATAAFHVSQITSGGVIKVQSELERLRSKLPYDLWLTIQFSLNTTRDKFQQFNLPGNSANAAVGYRSGVSGYQVNSGGEEEVKYTVGKDYAIGKKYEAKKGYNK